MLASTALAGAMLGAGALPAAAQDTTWLLNPVSGDWDTAANWSAGVPVQTGSALFGATNNANITLSNGASVYDWVFSAGASAYTFTNNGQTLLFFRNGIIVNGGSVHLIANSAIFFTSLSTAGTALIDNNFFISFQSRATAGSATINNNADIAFSSLSTAGDSTINNRGTISFGDRSTAGNSAITNVLSGSFVDFSGTAGPASDSKISVGSLAGGGAFYLGQNELTIGSNNRSTEVTGGIADGGVLGGTGASLVKIGTGTLTLSGANFYTGATTIDAGTLAVNGSLSLSSAVTVNSGGTLGGTGTVGNTTIATGGTLAPGNSIGTFNVNGDLTFNAGSNYNIEVSPGASDRTDVTGTATLTGATVNATFAGGRYLARQYTILNAANGFGGTVFTGVVNSHSPNIGASLSYDANNVYLDIVLLFVAPPDTGLNAAQSAVGNALVNYFNTNGGIPMVYSGLTASDLSQAAGQPGASVAQTGVTAAGEFVGAVGDSAFGDGGGQGGALGYAQVPTVSRAARDAYAAVTPRDRMAPSFEQRWNVWGSVYGGNSRVNGDAGAGTSTTTSRVYGTAIGASYRFTPDTQAGFALGGAGSNFGLAGGLGGGKADVFNMAVYARHNFGAAYVSGLLGYSWQDTTTDRNVLTDRLSASFKAQALSTRLEGGWRTATPMLGITPYAALQTTTFFMPSYGETVVSGNNTFALSYASKTTTATRGELGAKFDKAMLVQGGVFTLNAKTAWAHDWNTDRNATATFQALPGASFTTSGAQPSANAALLSLGATMKWHSGWSLSGSFDGEVSRTTTAYSGKGTLAYAW